jgi:protein involved in polysaccharide export with SLBB domain
MVSSVDASMCGLRASWLRWWMSCTFLLCLAFLQVGHTYAAEPAAYRLGSGDKLRVTVFGEKDLSGDFEVNDQGVVALPLIGPVQVAGKTINETETIITQRYGKDYLVNPRVTVEVLNYRPFYILGEVQKPGSYPYVGGLTVLNAVALAGGYTPRADRGDIKVRRAANPSAGEQAATESSVVLPGDVVRVPERFF